MFVSCECLIDIGKIYILSSLGHKTPLSTSVKNSCIFLSRREGSKGEGKQTDGIWGESIAGAVRRK